LKIKDEVEKQLNAGFLAVAKYPQWVANVVLVPKKDGKVQMCIDYRDLNRASPKDDFPLSQLISLWTIRLSFHCFHLWIDFLGTIRSKWHLKI